MVISFLTEEPFARASASTLAEAPYGLDGLVADSVLGSRAAFIAARLPW
jgi:hypothetical protein